MCFFFFTQRTAYEVRISDWSSDVCSSDLRLEAGGRSDEYDRLALEALDRRRRHADRTAAATARELDGSRHRLADPPFATAIVERGERRHEPRLRIERRRHEGDASGRLTARCLDPHRVAGAHLARNLSLPVGGDRHLAKVCAAVEFGVGTTAGRER